MSSPKLTLHCSLFELIFPLVLVGLACGAMAAGAQAAVDGNWPGWRGDGSGISGESNLPVYWDAQTNIAWKTALPGEGNSSPVVWGDRVFLTASTEGGKKRHVFCLSATDGRIVWHTELLPERETETYPKCGYASPTPATDGERVYVFFDSPGIVALDMEGGVVWKHDLGPFNNPYNLTSSPILCDDMVIMCCDQGGESFIYAFAPADGKVVWKTPRKTGGHYSTPVVITVGEKKQIVVNADPVIAYDSENGEELWSCRGMKNMVAPSAVFDGDLVYVTSGRNGPVMAIDPRGRGDISETGVRMHFPAGGPYVPSPVVYPYLFLPGDNGAAPLIDLNGEVVVMKRIRAHFTSSPVAADGRIYWTSEKGDTYVMDVSKVKEDPPQVEVAAVNSLGEKVLASPAIAGGRMYIRSTTHLFCISGGAQTEAPAVAAAPLGTFAELKKLYDEHQAPEGDEIALRLEIVESLGKIKDPRAIPLLTQIAQKDNHWDVSEEAVKVLGVYGEEAVPALIELLEFGDWRRYLKIVPAGHLARLKSVEAVPALLKLAGHDDPLVRIASLKALAEIADAHDAEAPKVITALTTALADRTGVVKRAAIDGLALLGDRIVDGRDALVKTMLDLAAGRNSIVARGAREALLESFKVPEDVVMMDEWLYGEQRKNPHVAYVNAGPVSMKFQDGELRYIKVGGKEIVRRIYFAVRDGRWDTVMPEFGRMNIEKQEGSFKIDMAGRCKNDIADFTWSGQIAGSPDGTITFAVEGRAGMDFRSYRVGICVLYGAESLAGQKYEVINDKGEITEGEFPKHVSPSLLANNFRTLRYTTVDGMQVITSLAETNFGMEDQRNFGDSSYKAFSGIPYKYPTVPRGEKGGQKLTLEVKNAPARPLPEGPITVTIGKPIPGAKIPKLLPAEQSMKGESIMSYNSKPDKYADAELIVLRYNPAAHMPDDDTYMENITAIHDQVMTIKSFAKKARIRVDPITIDSWYPRPGPDPRNDGLFGAAWCARMIRYLALAGVDEAVFKLAGKSERKTYAGTVQEMMAALEGRNVLAADAGPHAAVDVLAVDYEGAPLLWLINKTDRPQAVVVGKVPFAEVGILRLDASAAPEQPGPRHGRPTHIGDGSLEVELSPFEVCRISEQGAL